MGKRRLPACQGGGPRRTRHQDSGLGRGARHALLARGQLLELRLGQQRHLQDPARAGSLRHRVQRRCRNSIQEKPPPLNTMWDAEGRRFSLKRGSIWLNDNKRDYSQILKKERLNPEFKGYTPSKFRYYLCPSAFIVLLLIGPIFGITRRAFPEITFCNHSSASLRFHRTFI